MSIDDGREVARATRLDRLAAVARESVTSSPRAAEHELEQLAVLGRVVHDQHRHARQTPLAGRDAARGVERAEQRPGRRGRARQARHPGQHERERAALAGARSRALIVPPSASASRRADRQPEPGAAEATRDRRVGLGERVEQPTPAARRSCRCPNPRTATASVDVVGFHARRTRTPPLSVNLIAFARRGSSGSGAAARDRTRRFSGTGVSMSRASSMPFSRAFTPRTSTTLVRDADRGGGNRLDLHGPGLDLRQVEQVVDEPEQVLTARRDRGQVALARRGIVRRAPAQHVG